MVDATGADLLTLALDAFSRMVADDPLRSVVEQINMQKDSLLEAANNMVATDNRGDGHDKSAR